MRPLLTILSLLSLSACLNGQLHWAGGGSTSSSESGAGGGSSGSGNRGMVETISDTDFGTDGRVIHGFEYEFESTPGFHYIESVRGAAVLSDGKIVLGVKLTRQAGHGTPACGVLQLNSNGSINRSFGNANGLFLIDESLYSYSDCAVGGVLVRNNQIYFGGWMYQNVSDKHILFRLSASGIPDTFFGDSRDGYQVNDTIETNVGIRALGFDYQYRIVTLIGPLGEDTSYITFGRYSVNGTPDVEFGATPGMHRLNLGTFSSLRADSLLVHTPNSGVSYYFATGYGMEGSNRNAFIYALDPVTLEGKGGFTFGSALTGLAVYPGYSEATAIAYQELSPTNQYLLITGRRDRLGSTAEAYLMRVLLSNASPDASFGEVGLPGVRRLPTENAHPINTVGIAVLLNNAILILGHQENTHQTVFYRYQSGGQIDGTFSATGRRTYGSAEMASTLLVSGANYFAAGNGAGSGADVFLRRVTSSRLPLEGL